MTEDMFHEKAFARVDSTLTKAEVNVLLADVYTEEGVEMWWQTFNRNLGLTPNLAWEEGMESDVYDEAERLADG